MLHTWGCNTSSHHSSYPRYCSCRTSWRSSRTSGTDYGLIQRSAHQANLWFRKPSVRWSCSQRKKKLRSSPGIPSINKKSSYNSSTYSRRSRQSTNCCGEGWTWSIWQISQPHLPSLYHHRHILFFCAAKSEKLVKTILWFVRHLLLCFRSERFQKPSFGKRPDLSEKTLIQEKCLARSTLWGK